MANDKRNEVVAKGQKTLAGKTGMSVASLRKLSNEDYAALVDQNVATAIIK